MKCLKRTKASKHLLWEMKLKFFKVKTNWMTNGPYMKWSLCSNKRKLPYWKWIFHFLCSVSVIQWNVCYAFRIIRQDKTCFIYVSIKEFIKRQWHSWGIEFNYIVSRVRTFTAISFSFLLISSDRHVLISIRKN